MASTAILFYIFAAVILICAAEVVFSKNLVHSALFMVVTFVGVACIYLLLNADFLAVVQLLVYVGAISVLLVFGVMLTRRGDMSESNLFNKYRVAAGIVALALFGVIVRFVLLSPMNMGAVSVPQSTVAQIADLLLGDYVLPFEIAGLLLLVAMVGAIIIGKGEGKTK